MNSDKSITANFIRQYKLALASEEHGTTDPIPGEHIYDEGTKVIVTAIPDTHYRFNGWSGNVPSGKENDNPILKLSFILYEYFFSVSKILKNNILYFLFLLYIRYLVIFFDYS